MTNAAKPNSPSASRTLLLRDGLNEALHQEMARDERVFCIGVGIAERGGSYKVTAGLLAEFGEKRVIDTPLAEASFTGAGIGAALTERLLAEGYQLSLGVRDPEATRKAVPGLAENAVLIHKYNAYEPATAEDWVGATVEKYGHIDGLINNAGILHMIDFEIGDEEMLDDLWAVNVKAPFRLTRLVLPYLRKADNGRIVNIASTDAKRYRDATVSVGYAMTKHALLAMSHAAKFAGWDDGVRVTALCPGAVATELVAHIDGVVPLSDRLSPELIGRIVSFILGLPNTASVAELPVNTRLESTI